MPKRRKNRRSTSTESEQLRLRVFAGPNGSGKSTVIDTVRKIQVSQRQIDFGHYINADDIYRQLAKSPFEFADFQLKVTNSEFAGTAMDSGLVNEAFTEGQFRSCYTLRSNKIRLKNKVHGDRLAQIIADFLRKKLLEERRKFSFETVFSHGSKLDIMREAVALGYKVYLYFVSTSSPKINVFRVEARKRKGGHDVPKDKITSRYFRSLDLLYDACQLAYQAFFFDNSVDGRDSVMFAHFKKNGVRKKWDKIDPDSVPDWFIKYYSGKVKKNRRKRAR